MKKLFKTPFLIAFLATSLIFTSCGDDGTDDPILGDDPIENPDEPVVVENEKLIVTTDNAGSADRMLEIDAEPNSLVNVDVDFTSSKNMFRLYITKYTYGDTDIETYVFPDNTFDTKADGSLDLSKDQKESFVQTISFDAPTALNETVQYNIWATSGRGDFRDVSKRNVFEDDSFGTIVIRGSETAPMVATTEIREFTSIIRLNAPAADGTSESFISVFDGITYNIVQQENADVVSGTFTEDQKTENSELAALWDFGYFYTNSNGASFASASNYMSAFTVGGEAVVKITDFTGLGVTELNQFFFASSTINFDAATNNEIDAITSSGVESITNLSENEVIEFVDNYGNKGLIRINTIEEGFNPTDYIEFDVKVQVNSVPVIL